MSELTALRWRKSSRSGNNGCIEVGALRWRKSSRSGNNACVEVAAPRWRKSTRSGDNGCVEVAGNLPETVAVRDSKDVAGPMLRFTPAAWRAFAAAVPASRGPGN